MVLTSSLGELMVDQILWYYQIVHNINERAFIHIEIYIRGAYDKFPDFFSYGHFY